MTERFQPTTTADALYCPVIDSLPPFICYYGKEDEEEQRDERGEEEEEEEREGGRRE